MKTSVSAIAAMLAAASFGGSALAEGDYFEGPSKTQVNANAGPRIGAQADVDFVTTGSISNIRLDDLQDGQPVLPHTSRDDR